MSLCGALLLRQLRNTGNGGNLTLPDERWIIAWDFLGTFDPGLCLGRGAIRIALAGFGWLECLVSRHQARWLGFGRAGAWCRSTSRSLAPVGLSVMCLRVALAGFGRLESGVHLVCVFIPG